MPNAGIAAIQDGACWIRGRIGVHVRAFELMTGEERYRFELPRPELVGSRLRFFAVDVAGDVGRQEVGCV